MTRPYRQYTDADVIKAASEVTSMLQLLSKLGLKAAGGNYKHVTALLSRLNVNLSHWKGQGWSDGRQLKDYKDYKRPHNFKKHLIEERGHRCEQCLNSSWNEVPIPLELHHVDGDVKHNDKTNLQLLCPNCHALTDNWRRRK